MGVKNLWPLVDGAAVTVKLRDFMVENGFIKEHYCLHTTLIGIDISIFLDAFCAADMAVKQMHATTSPLSQLFKFLCYLSQAGVHGIFVYDGKEHPRIKRGRQVITREPGYYTQARALIEAFGYYAYTAPGEADAELAEMCKRGLVDAVFTKDSDLLPLGAPRIFRPLRLDHKPQNFKDFETVLMYNAETIESHLEFSHAGLILISLLLKNDYSDGVNGIGSETAAGLAKCGYGDDLLKAYSSFSTMPQQLAEAFNQLNNDMVEELEFNTHHKLRYRSPYKANVLRVSRFPLLRDLSTLTAFLEPVTSWSRSMDSSGAPNASKWPPRTPDIMEITKFCCNTFGWPDKHALKRFHAELWPAVIMRMLSSKYLRFKEKEAEILVPRLQSTFAIDANGKSYPSMLSTIVRNKNSLRLQGMRANDAISTTFTTEFFLQLTGLASSVSETSRRVDVPAAMIAVALQQSDQIRGLNKRLGPPPSHVIHVEIDILEHGNASGSGQNYQENPTKRKHASTSLNERDEPKRLRPMLKHLGTIELTDSED
ncbi:PIN domain-like protein [Lentinula aff. lateritia]|uniref:PIN domain-like protein n=1 Tax=Lentinula aff. lateritia TaxID=2804960 RepID=A0ACC1TKT4_9AGAR|nr:PIN domain-like protein [Lentinula aff. lateritia]